MEYKIVERDCKNCENYKPLMDKNGEVIGAACCKWVCVKEQPEPDLDCALRD